MSTPENPLATVLRLIDNRLRVIKENGAVAAVKCTEENYDRELLKGVDGQITCSLLERQDQKLNLNGSKRRKVALLKVVCVATNQELPFADPGRIMRDKLATQINAIIHECRQVPYVTIYNFYGLGYPEGTPHKAKDAAESSELAPSLSSWVELSAESYQKIWANDDVLHSKASSTAGQYPQMLYRLKIGKAQNSDLQPIKTCLKGIDLTWVGFGTSAAGNGATVKVWNNATGAWTNTVTGSGNSKESLAITLSSGLADYIDAEGYLWLFARTTNPSAGEVAALYCDFIQCIIHVQGLTNIDVVSDKPTDVTDVKPYLFRHEFQLRGWYFEAILL